MIADQEKVCVSGPDIYRAWLAENCRPDFGKFAPCRDAFDDFQAFAADRGELTAGSIQAFGRAMRQNRLQVSVRRIGGQIFKAFNDIALVPGPANAR